MRPFDNLIPLFSFTFYFLVKFDKSFGLKRITGTVFSTVDSSFVLRESTFKSKNLLLAVVEA